ncbi:MAG: hypothetical protein OET44_16055 [Gammaproteobacteria bacterium]|nr:hypothetical protein [Gammaproteobacteria bacterium]
MKPIFTVEFTAKVAGVEFKEESVSLHGPEELFDFVAPGGGCDRIPDDVNEIQMVFQPPARRNEQNPIADVHAMLELGRVFFNGPLAMITQTMEQLLDKAGRGELSRSFLAVIGMPRIERR